MFTADESGSGTSGSPNPPSTDPNATATAAGALTAGAPSFAGASVEAGDDEGEDMPLIDAEPPIETPTPTPTQAEVDDVKRGVRMPDPPPSAAKKVRNMNPGRDGTSKTRGI